MRSSIAFLAIAALVSGAALGAEVPARYARFTFGALGGKRQMAEDARRLYYLTADHELAVAEKPGASLPGLTTASPSPLGKLHLEGIPETLEWVNERTLCVGTGHHLAFVDVKEPVRPTLLAEMAVASREIEGVSGLRRAGPSLYVAARRQGLLRVDVSRPKAPRRTGALPLAGFASAVDVRGDLAAVATGVGFALVSLEGGGMKLESEVDTLRNAEVARLFETRLVFASKEYVVVYDISDLKHPVELAELSSRDPFFNSYNVALEADREHIYVAATEGGLYVYDWKDPRSPRLQVQFSFWGNEHRVSVGEKIRYAESLGLSGSREELARAISPVENIHIPAVGMAVDGRRVYLADLKGRLWALELDLHAEPSARCVMRPD